MDNCFYTNTCCTSTVDLSLSFTILVLLIYKTIVHDLIPGNSSMTYLMKENTVRALQNQIHNMRQDAKTTEELRQDLEVAVDEQAVAREAVERHRADYESGNARMFQIA